MFHLRALLSHGLEIKNFLLLLGQVGNAKFRRRACLGVFPKISLQLGGAEAKAEEDRRVMKKRWGRIRRGIFEKEDIQREGPFSSSSGPT